MSVCIIYKNNFDAFENSELNFDELSHAGLHEKHALVT
jgi:hypothetical protein